MGLIKHDRGKPNWALLPLVIIKEIVEVLTFGAEKYSPGGWQKGEFFDSQDRYFAAALRHLEEFQSGKRVDEESGLSPLAHALCNIMFVLWYERFKQPLGGSNAQQVRQGSDEQEAAR